MNKKNNKPEGSRRVRGYLAIAEHHLDQYEPQIGHQEAAFHLSQAGGYVTRARLTAGECRVCMDAVKVHETRLSRLETIHRYIIDMRFQKETY